MSTGSTLVHLLITVFRPQQLLQGGDRRPQHRPLQPHMGAVEERHHLRYGREHPETGGRAVQQGDGQKCQLCLTEKGLIFQQKETSASCLKPVVSWKLNYSEVNFKKKSNYIHHTLCSYECYMELSSQISIFKRLMQA